LKEAGTGLVARIALFTFGVIIAVAVAEVALRLAGVSYPNFFSFWVPDPYCGAFHRAGASGWWSEEGHAWVSINSDGLRDVEHTIAKPPNTFRIAILGDSYAEAFQVPARHAFWAVMERDLARCPALGGRRVEAINFGVSDFGTAQELQMLRHRVWKYSPDMVLGRGYSRQ